MTWGPAGTNTGFGMKAQNGGRATMLRMTSEGCLWLLLRKSVKDRRWEIYHNVGSDGAQ